MFIAEYIAEYRDCSKCTCLNNKEHTWFAVHKEKVEKIHIGITAEKDTCGVPNKCCGTLKVGGNGNGEHRFNR